MPDQALVLTSAVFDQLATLRSAPKFQEEELYPGAPTEEIRKSAEVAINRMLDRLRSGLPHSPQKSYVLSEFLKMLKAFEVADTEEREKACAYCERVMDLVGIESSDKVLNAWLYGFDPTQ
jgi:Domain of unknown function (DUF4844)